MIINEIRYVLQYVLFFRIIMVSLDYSARNNADAALFRQGSVFIEVGLPLIGEGCELWFIRKPIG